MKSRIKTVMEERNITIADLAAQTGIHAQDLYQAMKGVKPFWPGWKQRVAEALDTTVEELFGEEGQDNDQ